MVIYDAIVIIRIIISTDIVLTYQTFQTFKVFYFFFFFNFPSALETLSSLFTSLL